MLRWKDRVFFQILSDSRSKYSSKNKLKVNFEIRRNNDKNYLQHLMVLVLIEEVHNLACFIDLLFYINEF